MSNNIVLHKVWCCFIMVFIFMCFRRHCYYCIIHEESGAEWHLSWFVKSEEAAKQLELLNWRSQCPFGRRRGRSCRYLLRVLELLPPEDDFEWSFIVNRYTRTTAMTPKAKNPFAGVRYEHLVAGVSGGVASTLILHPLDLLKIRFAGKFFLIYLLLRCYVLFCSVNFKKESIGEN